MRLITAHEHTGLAAALMHDLKYRGAVGYADLVAARLAPRVPAAPVAAIPRSWARYGIYGVDAAEEIAIRIARLNRVPFVRLFDRRWHTPRRAGHNRNRPATPALLRVRPEEPVVLVDDVVTTGATLMSAIRSIGRELVILTVAANDAASPSTLAGMSQADGLGSRRSP
jgi:predicted amidophosphoribosyltransferase